MLRIVYMPQHRRYRRGPEGSPGTVQNADELFRLLGEMGEDPADLLTPWVAKSLLGPHSWVRAVWRAIEQRLLQAPRKLIAADEDDPRAIEARDLVAQQFGYDGHKPRTVLGFEAYLRPMLRYAFLGFRYAEEIYYLDGDRLWLRELQDREPTAHHRWDVRRGPTGTYLHSVIQRSAAGVHRIHADHLTVCTFDRTGDNYSGVGLGAGLPFWARLKRFIARSTGVVVDQMSTPAVRSRIHYAVAARAEEMGAGQAGALIERERERSEAQASDWQARERNAIHDADVATVEPVQFKLELSGHISMIRECDAQIAMALIAQFMLSGTNGARAGYDTAELLGDVFAASCGNILDGVAEALNGRPRPGGGVIGRIVHANLGPDYMDVLPEASFGTTNTAPLLKALNGIMQLIQPGALLLDDEGTIDEGIRAALNLPQLAPDTRRALVQKVREQAQIAGRASGGMNARVPGVSPSPSAMASFFEWRGRLEAPGPLAADLGTYLQAHPEMADAVEHSIRRAA